MASLFLLATSLYRPAGVLAQSGAGSIQGTVQDSTASALPGCAVHIVNEGTGVSFDTTANGIGFYSIPGLFAGNYTVTFSAPGMKKYQASVALQNAQSAVISPKLLVGDVAEQVTVTEGEVQLVTYDRGTVSTHLDRSRIDQLPQNGRNLLALASATTPGLESGGHPAGMESSKKRGLVIAKLILATVLPVASLSLGSAPGSTPQKTAKHSKRPAVAV